MELRRVTIALSFAGLAGAGIAAAEGPQDKPAPPQILGQGTFRGAVKAARFDVSPPLRLIPPVPRKVEGEREADKDGSSGLEGPYGPQTPDGALQSRIGPGEIPGPNLSFDGFDNLCGGCTPPDPVGDVGPNHYVAMANTDFAVYNKAGALVFGPVNINTLWAGFGGECQVDNSGDPIVLHDQMADRWLLSQFTASGPTFFNCVAVSTSPDPTGSYFRYAFPTVPPQNFPDYPKYGVWPDAYYLSTREFLNGQTFSGVGAYALDRAQMIAGNPAAQAISFLATPAGAGGMFNVGDGLLPSDLDGTTLPPVGSPNFFVGSRARGGPTGAPSDSLTFWRFHVDFAVPANSTFTLTDFIPVATFDSIFPCVPAGSRNCIPQPGTPQRIDILSYRQRTIWRLAYRNFGTHESLVTNQSVEAPAGIAGTRWYEIRSPQTTPVLFQQGTYSPGATDGIHRWMGSLAMDRAGNMALGYSVSDGVSTFPGIRYTGRLASDPLGEMPQGEGTIVNGLGSQLSTGARWGDYTSMNVDPTDDCTFWYINEYYPVTSNTGWRLRIGQFQFPAPQCIPVPVELQGFHIE
jgi:hypothetical protein